MQLELFGSNKMIENPGYNIKTRVGEAIFRQKNEAAWQTEIARKKAAQEEFERQFAICQRIEKIARTFEGTILEAISAGETQCFIDIDEDCWKSTVIWTDKFVFADTLLFKNDCLDSQSEFYYQVEKLRQSGVSYTLDKEMIPTNYGPHIETRTLMFHW